MWDLPKGENFLPKVSIGNLRTMYGKEQRTKPKIRLLCAIHRKEGQSIDEIVSSTNMKRRTVHETLKRFMQRGINAKDSIKQNGRPPKLSIKQRRELIKILEGRPAYNPHGLWTTKEVKELVKSKFGIEYTNVHIWELLKATGFSIQKPRPRNYLAPSKWKMTHFKKRLQCWRNITGKEDLS